MNCIHFLYIVISLSCLIFWAMGYRYPADDVFMSGRNIFLALVILFSFLLLPQSVQLCGYGLLVAFTCKNQAI